MIKRNPNLTTYTAEAQIFPTTLQARITARDLGLRVPPTRLELLDTGRGDGSVHALLMPLTADVDPGDCGFIADPETRAINAATDRTFGPEVRALGERDSGPGAWAE